MEELGIGVVDVQVVLDGLFELTGRSVGAATDVLRSEGGEPALHLIEP